MEYEVLPINDYIIVEPIKNNAIKVHIEEDIYDTEAEVIAVSGEADYADGQLVLFGEWAGQTFYLNGVKQQAIRTKDVIALVNGPF